MPPEPNPVETERPAGKRSELVQVAAAANAGWEVPEAGKRKAVYDCLAILADPDAGGRLKMTATRTLLAIERLNQSAALKAATTGSDRLAPDIEALIDRVYGETPCPPVAPDPPPGPDGGPGHVAH